MHAVLASGVALEWVDVGTRLWLRQVSEFDEADFAADTLLEGWTRKHLVGHLAANGTAVANLVHWARTGVETPMYASFEQRDADIAAATACPGGELVMWFARTAREVDDGLAALTPEQWQAPVRNAVGHTVTAEAIPWMRARELLVHVVDLDAGVGWSDLPEAFLRVLVDDVAGMRAARPDHPELELRATDTEDCWRIGSAPAQQVSGALADLASYLTGRGQGSVTGSDQVAPTLPSWI